ncbi:MAG: hypothetical protein ACRDP5_05495 [Streptosporangiaceae bacterium]
MNRARGGRLGGPLTRPSNFQDCVERRRRFEAEQPGVVILAPVCGHSRWRAILPFGVLPGDGTTLGANSLCDLMDDLDQVYPAPGRSSR